MLNNINVLSLSDINNLLYNNKDSIIKDNLNYFLNKDDNMANTIIIYYLSNYYENKEIVNKISRHKNLHIRYLFMSMLIKYYNDLIGIIYNDITKYLKTKNNFMDVKEVSELAILFYKQDNIKLYYQFKKYILKNYKYNYLASKLLEIDDNNKEFIDNIENYYKSSFDKRLYIVKYYNKYLKQEIIDNMNDKIKYFIKPDYSYRPIDRVYEFGLGDKIEELVDKYLSLSNDSNYEYLGSGSTASAYKIGDYVFKLSNKKWSYEDVICPNLYLIIKNYEEILLRKENNEVYLGIEVQKYLAKNTKNIDNNYYHIFENELKNQGYYIKDTLNKGNIRILNSYLDADTNDFDSLPDWFKETPMVLVDRDLIYRVDNKNPKSLFLKR